MLAEVAIEITGALQRAEQALSPMEPDPSPAGPNALTGLPNRRASENHLAELAESVPATETCWLLVADIDRFKDINDRHGHPTGDAYLTALADVVRAHVFAPHFAARIGGEELAGVLRHLTLEQARTLADELRLAVEDLHEPAQATISIGLAGWLPASEQAEEAFRRADMALYRASKRGRQPGLGRRHRR